MQFERLQQQILQDIVRDSQEPSPAPSKSTSVSASTPGQTPPNSEKKEQELSEDFRIKISLEKNIFDQNLYHVALLTETRKRVSPPPPPPTPIAKRPLIRFQAVPVRRYPPQFMLQRAQLQAQWPMRRYVLNLFSNTLSLCQ